MIRPNPNSANTPILLQIAAIEATQDRAVREALLGDTTALSRLQAIDTAIAALRAQLTPE